MYSFLVFPATFRCREAGVDASLWSLFSALKAGGWFLKGPSEGIALQVGSREPVQRIRSEVLFCNFFRRSVDLLKKFLILKHQTESK
jgi:hypothetical protein